MTMTAETTETVEITAENWRLYARCLLGNPYGVKPELFWPVGDAQPARDQEALAKAECHQCPVMAFCREWALTAGEVDGVSGGMTPAEKQATVRARRARRARVAA